MSMIERVAKAILHDFTPHIDAWDLADESDRSRCRGYARAAIEAMREPEVEMISAFWRQKNTGAQVPGEWSEFRSDYDAYRAMIDQALKDEA